MDNNQLNMRRRNQQPDDNRKDNFIVLRNWLNIIFMVGALVGVGFYIFSDQTTGIIIVLAAMIFKMVEAALRFIR